MLSLVFLLVVTVVVVVVVVVVTVIAYRFIILSVCLIFLGKQKAASEMFQAFETLPSYLKDFATVLLDVCAYAGTLMTS